MVGDLDVNPYCIPFRAYMKILRKKICCLFQTQEGTTRASFLLGIYPDKDAESTEKTEKKVKKHKLMGIIRTTTRGPI